MNEARLRDQLANLDARLKVLERETTKLQREREAVFVQLHPPAVGTLFPDLPATKEMYS